MACSLSRCVASDEPTAASTIVRRAHSVFSAASLSALARVLSRRTVSGRSLTVTLQKHGPVGAAISEQGQTQAIVATRTTIATATVTTLLLGVIVFFLRPQQRIIIA